MLLTGLHRLGMTMTVFALTGAVLVVVIGIFRGFRDPNNDDNAPWLQSILLAISMAVSAIPEGLPLVVTICLALGTTAMAKNNALIRRLPAVETLGSASVICSDKTGTLTSGKMTLTKAWAFGKTYNVSGEGYDPTRGSVTDAEGNVVDTSSAGQHAALSASMNVANLCNEATVKCVEGRWKSIGTSTEAALVVGTEKFGLDTNDNRQAHKRLLNVPFSSTFKMMATVQEVSSTTDPVFVPDATSGCSGPLVVLSKGAPFSILALCCSVLTDNADNAVVPLTPEMTEQIEKEVDVLSSSGLRVLAVCYKRIPELPLPMQQNMDDALSSEEKLKLCVCDMVFCGLLGMMDPPRRGVRHAVRRAKKGGIRTVMITGDYLKTAVAIAEMVDIVELTMDDAESAIDCSRLRPGGAYLATHEIDAITWHSFVFARAKPEDKLQIVKSFQRQGFVCAMTGDGVNDAPALRQANIGIAMGLAGSEVAKAASDMILTDDKFSSIVEAVELGRTIYANLRKFVMYLIGTNWSQVLVILVSVLIGMPAPLEPLQILFINLITDGAPAIALSIEKAESNVMKEKPRQRDEEILSGMIVLGIIRHASSLVVFMLFSFYMGLWWETGEVLLSHMYEDDELVETCERLNGSGVWETINDKDCVKDGLKIARTMVFLTIVFSESLRPLTARSFSASIHDDVFENRYLIYAILFSICCMFIIVFTPGLNDIFHVASPNWYEWLLVIAGVVLTIFSDEQMKVRLRDETENDGRWNKLFDRLADSSRELRNMRARLAELTNAKEK
jgi:P-type Ca2+ transporter type 2C